MGARLLFLASLNLADDEGLLRWNEAYLSSQAFVYDELNTEQISEWMSELVTEGIIFPYKAGKTNQRLGWIVSFRKHQVINRPQPGKLPPPSIQNSEYRVRISERDGHVCHLCGGMVDMHASNNQVGSTAPSVDHLKPVSIGGDDYPSNLRLAHLSCNKSRKDKPLVDSIGVNDSVNDSVPERKGKERIKTEPAKAVGFVFKTELLNIGADPVLAADWMAVRKTKKASNTKTALDDFMREVNKAGYTVDQALRICCVKSWKGFDAEWVKDIKPVQASAPIPFDPEAYEAKRKADAAAARERMRQEQASWEAQA